VIGRVREANADKQRLIREKKAKVLEGKADMEAGHKIAQQVCFTCHKLYGEGADIGPDLTGVGRSTLDALLANVIDPNQIIGKGYENVEIETKDGRSVSGRVVEETDSKIKIVSAGPKEEVIAKSDIASKRVTENSVMPEGLEQMPEADFRNLMMFILKPPQER
jgi:putative heme-binding domain-containing protein